MVSSTETIATVADLAEAAAVPEQMIWRWIRSGRLPARLPTARRTRSYRFPVEAVEQARHLGEAYRLLKGTPAAASQATG